MNKVKTAKAHFHPIGTFCVHGCFMKHDMASFCRLVVYNKPIKFLFRDVAIWCNDTTWSTT